MPPRFHTATRLQTSVLYVLMLSRSRLPKPAAHHWSSLRPNRHTSSASKVPCLHVSTSLVSLQISFTRLEQSFSSLYAMPPLPDHTTYRIDEARGIQRGSCGIVNLESLLIMQISFQLVKIIILSLQRCRELGFWRIKNVCAERRRTEANTRNEGNNGPFSEEFGLIILTES